MSILFDTVAVMVHVFVMDLFNAVPIVDQVCYEAEPDSSAARR